MNRNPTWTEHEDIVWPTEWLFDVHSYGNMGRDDDIGATSEERRRKEKGRERSGKTTTEEKGESERPHIHTLRCAALHCGNQVLVDGQTIRRITRGKDLLVILPADLANRAGSNSCTYSFRASRTAKVM